MTADANRPFDPCLCGIPVELPDWIKDKSPPPYVPGEGYFQVDADCGHRIWIGPQIAAAKKAEPERPLICAVCAAIAAKLAGLSRDDITAVPLQEYNSYKGN
jgi:hypothetical protein